MGSGSEVMGVQDTRHKTQDTRPDKGRVVNIFILVDALGWNYIKDRKFLNDICTYRQKVKSILGYSCGVIPSILKGRLPSEHKKSDKHIFLCKKKIDHRLPGFLLKIFSSVFLRVLRG